MREGRVWFAELKKAGVNRMTAHRYMKKALAASGLSQVLHGPEEDSENLESPPTCDVADLSCLVSAGRTFGAIYADPPMTADGYRQPTLSSAGPSATAPACRPRRRLRFGLV